MNNEHRDHVVPFGKYKGQPLEVLANDQSYLDWLNGQGWVKDKYPQFYTVIINNFAEPSDTPEHNALQALFLDDDLCVRLLSAVACIRHNGFWFRELTSKQFEQKGIDVILEYSGFSLLKYSRLEKEEWRRLEPDEMLGWACHEFRCAIEIKPSLGDDFPAVLRQASRMENGQPCVVFRDFVATSVTLEQVRAMFGLSGVLLFSLDEIQHAEPDRRFDAWLDSRFQSE